MTEKIEIKEFTYVPRGILFFIDDSEKEKESIGAIGGDLLIALYQHAGPIIVSASLLRTFFSENAAQAAALVGKNAQQLAKEYQTAFWRANKAEQKAILMKALNFELSQWAIKEINDFLYLLVPQEYVQALKIDMAIIKKVSDEPKITPVELQLGLKVNHMKNITSLSEITSKTIGEPSRPHYVVNALYNTSRKTSDIFCMRSDYHAHNESQVPLWTIYMDGHGTMNGKIVGMGLDDFKEVLNFFEKSINTRLLIYKSCYAAGLNNEIIYKDARTAIHKTYPFAIITQAITDAPVMGIGPRPEEVRGKLELEILVHFDDFLHDVQSEVIDYAALTKYLFPSLPEEKLKGFGLQVWANVPQIKLPGVEWFSVMASQKDIVSIGSILAKTFDANKPLDVVKYFKTDPKAILLYAADIPFELIINTNNLEAIISMIPREAVHKIKKISSQKKIDEITQWFMSIEMLDTHKTFFIKTVNSIDDVIIYNKKIPANIMGGIPDVYECYAFYRDKDTVYVRTAKQTKAQIATTAQINNYEQLLKKLRGGIQTRGVISSSVDESKYGGPLFGQFTEPTEIEKIMGKDGKILNIANIIFELQLGAGGTGLVWVKEIEGTYPGLEKGLTDKDFIVIKDVVIDKSQKDAYFTYNNNFYKGKTKLDKDYRDEYKKRMAAPQAQPKGDFDIATEDIEKLKKVLVTGRARQENVLVQDLLSLQADFAQLLAVL